MPWKEVTVVEERLKFVLKAFKSKENFTEQCRRFGISTKTGYKWLKRFEEGGAKKIHTLYMKKYPGEHVPSP